MSRKKDRTLWQHRFNLSSDDPAHKRLHEKLEELALTDEAGDFMRAALLEYLDKRTAPLYQGSTTVVPGLQEPVKAKPELVRPTPKADKESGGEVKTQPLLSPAELLRQRKADAALRHPTIALPKFGGASSNGHREGGGE